MQTAYDLVALSAERQPAGVAIAGVALPPGQEGELVVDATADATFTEYLLRKAFLPNVTGMAPS